ncbi:NAD(P)/FAD-dependent oxidoreductase [Fodinibius salsisoli]|uniref:FAD-dependent oxidoreductase n=1 Tax=Fodinibius salsisoli TaxID=2820877 RepID=A0ABT3PNZ2_9BACT|nr:FAD-dependent oxidoreductase [Fodinibius salsisoli]MCW9707577.1 FAD-dependent oxidoreductase [Fodinibius salsisoli]
MMNNTDHVIVIGAGIAGLAVAYYLRRNGITVTICEKGDGEDNCSYGNAGLIAPRHIIPLSSPGVISEGLRWMLKAESPFYIKPRLNKELISWIWKFRKASTEKHVDEAGPVLRDMLFRNQNLLIDLEKKESISFGFQKNGHLTICKTEKGLKKEAKKAQKASALGVPTEVLSAKEVQEMEPNIRMDIHGAVYYPKDAHLHPGHLMEQLKALLQKQGVNFRFNTEITDINEKSEGKVDVVSSDNQKLSGTQVVLCSGAWTPELLKRLNFKLPLQAGKGYSITLDSPSTVPQINFLLAEKKVAVTPMMGDLRFAGTMEIVGKDQSVTPAKISALKKSVTQYFPEYSLGDLDGQDVWVGLRPCSPDGLPYVGKVEPFNSIFVSTGHSMVGMSLSFASGEIISQLITENQAKLSHPMMDPNRYM